MKIDLEQIRELLQVVSATEVTELTIEFGDQRITVKKAITVTETSAKPIVVKTEVAQSQPVSMPKPQSVAQAVSAGVPEQTPAPNNNDSYNGSGDASKNGHVEITSPMVGTFYRSPSPEAAPFVNIGDHVTVGQTVCIIEAMKLMNDMPSEVSGKIVKILVDNGTTVEYGQPLFLLDPKG